MAGVTFWSDNMAGVKAGASTEIPPPMLHLSPVTGEPGFPTRAELVALYERRSGHRVSGLGW